MAHTVKIFIVDDALEYIHHDADHPNDDNPGKHLELLPGDRVRWKSTDGNITIHFDDSPFESGTTDLPDPTLPPRDHTGYEIIRSDAKPDKNGNDPAFKYTATVGGVTDDPEIIIDLGTGGPGG